MTCTRPAALTLAATLLLAACGGDSGTNSGDQSTMSATVAGTAWSATLAVQGQVSGNILSISGTNGTYQVALTVPGVSAPGTYAVGPGNSGIAQLVQIITGTPTWTSSLVGGSGTIVVTALTASRVAGTFSFSGAPSPGSSASGTRAVTNGTFDLKL